MAWRIGGAKGALKLCLGDAIVYSHMGTLVNCAKYVCKIAILAGFVSTFRGVLCEC